MKIISRVLDTLLKTIMVISTVGVLLVSIIMICSRFITHTSIGWTTDILRLCFVYSVFGGIAYCAKTNEHLNLDVILSTLPEKIRQIVEVLILIVVITFCVIITIIGYKYTLSGVNQAVSFTRMPMSIYYCVIPISFGLMVIYYFELLIQKIKTILKKEENV